MNYQIIRLKSEKERFFVNYNEYLERNLHSPKFLLDYIEILKIPSKFIICDESFVVIENNKCVGICFLPIENINGIKSISLQGNFTLQPLAICDRIYDIIFEEIFSIAKVLNLSKIMFYLDSLMINKFNWLLKYGFIDTSTSNCLALLNVSRADLWRNLRKRYKSQINSVMKSSDFEFFILNKDNQNYKIHEIYRALHAKAAGKETRPKASFDKQYELLKRGFATIIALKWGGVFIGMSYFMHCNNLVVYFSGADDPEFTQRKIPIYHAVLWKAMEYFSQLGFKVMEYSEPCGYNKINGFMDYMDEKQINIGFFKRGMSTQMTTYYKGIKYFDKNLLLSDIDKFKQKVLKEF